MRFLELKKNLKRDFSGFKKIKLALLGDSATQHLTQVIRGYGLEDFQFKSNFVAIATNDLGQMLRC